MYLRSLFALAAAVLLLGETEPSRPAIELRLRALQIRDGVPQAFQFEFVNVSDHRIHLAAPALECGDSFAGSLWIEVGFKDAAQSSADESGGHLCVTDHVREAVLQRVGTWKTLNPGESYTITADRAHLFYRDGEAGEYSFRATYTPPQMNKDDQDLLRHSGIDYVTAPLTSERLEFAKSQ